MNIVSKPIPKIEKPIPEIKITIEDSPTTSQIIDAASIEQKVSLLKNFLGDTKIQSASCAMFLRADNSLIGILKTGVGNADATIIDTNLVVATALKTRAKAVVTCNTMVSNIKGIDDNTSEAIQDFKESLDMFGIVYLNHIIITPHNYVSENFGND